MKKTLALLLALCMAFSMFSVSAFATAQVTYNVALVDENGEAVTEVEAGESVWAVISVDNYADYVGDSNIDWDADDIALASEYNKNIAVITTFIELDTTAFTVATESGKIVWDSPYKTDIADQGGSMQYNLDGNVLKTLLQTDSEGGVYYAITKSELDANNGELYRVKLNTTATASGAYTVALNGGTELAAPGMATITSAAGDANITVDDVAVALGAAANLQVNGGEITEPEVPVVKPTAGDPFVFFDGMNAADWNATADQLATIQASGSISHANASDSVRGGESWFTHKNAFDSLDYFEFTCKIANINKDGFAAVSVGDLTVMFAIDKTAEGTVNITNDGHLYLIVKMGDEIIYTLADGSWGNSTNQWIVQSLDRFKAVYDNGKLTATYIRSDNGNTGKIVTNLDLTALDGWDSSYTTLNQTVKLGVYSWWQKNNYTTFSKLSLTGITPVYPVCPHENTIVTGEVEATCGAAGYTGDIVCNDCGETIETGTETPATGLHDETTVTGAVDATCGAAGYTGDTVCVACGETIETGSEIPATGEHAWGEFVPDEDGLTETKTCGTCGATETQDIVVEECTHEWSEWEITTEATSTTTGIKTRTCGLCGATETQEFTIATSGTTGDVTWRFENGTLYIEGTGKMGNYANVGDVAPWQVVRKETTAIVIGDGITYIGNRSFKGFNKVTTVTIGKDVESTGYECFYNCTALKTVDFQTEKLTNLGSAVFYNCGFETIEIPASVTNLENRAFKLCKNLTAIVMPNSVTTTGYEIFMGCTALTDVTISTRLNMINPLIFKECTALEEIFIPQNIFRIRSEAFTGCSALAVIDFEDDDKLYGSSTEGKIASNSFAGCASTLTFKAWMNGNANLYASQKGFQFEAKNTSTFIYTVDANNNATITGMRGESTNANIPETVDGYTVVAIGNQAFRDNTRITRVTIPATCTTIGGRAFQGCTALATVNGLENVTSIAYSAFQDCSALANGITFANGLTAINKETFKNCTALGEIYVPNTITTVDNLAFTGCTNATIKTQENSAAAKAAANQGVAVKIVTDFDYIINADGESVTVTGVLGNVTNLVIPDEINGLKVTNIQQRAFKNNTTIETVVIGDNVSVLLYEVFMNCSNVKTVVVGSGVTEVGSKTFAGMTSLESITFENGDVTINNEAFTDTPATITVYGVADSAVQAFAEKKGFTFVAM